jgi:lycopene cyclase domain-containing protein
MTLVVFIAWVFFIWLLFFSGWRPGTYLGLLFVWALPPVMLQTWFGGDILWRHRKMILLSIIPMTLYLAASDKLAITSGTWTINPEQSLEAIGILILGRLPVEEFLFFMMTNTLITLGCTLMTSVDSRQRARRWVATAQAAFSRTRVSREVEVES